MPCDTCTEQSNNNLPYNFGNPVETVNCTQSTCASITDALCVKYTSTNFSCISNESKSLEDILKSIDSLVCEVSGGIPWATFDYACLEGITTAQTFAEIISAYVCDLSETVTNNYDELLTLINNINITGVGSFVPAISGCTYTGVVNTDTLSQILVKFNTKFCDLNSRLDISSVDWDQCFTVLTPPTTLPGAFDLLIDQICQVKADIPTGYTPPTFNNVGTCLPTPGATDSLTSTISKIIAKLCSLPTLDIDELSPFLCTGLGSTLTEVIENIRIRVTENTLRSIEEVGPGLTLVDLGSPEACTGKRLEIDPDAFPDEMVKVNSSDTTPGYLIDKLNAGDNITIDDTTLVGAVTITAEDAHVKTSSIDPATGYLLQKILVDSLPELSFALTEDSTTDPSSYKAKITPTIDWYALTEKVLLTIVENSTLRSIFCNIDCEILPTCLAPSNFSVIWTAPNFVIGYGVPVGITGVNVYYREKGTGTWLTANVAPTNPQPAISASSILVTTLDTLTIYEFKVSCICPDTSESDSNILEAFSTAAIPVTVTPTTSSLQYNFDNNDFIDYVTVTLKTTLGVTVGIQIATGPALSTTFTGLSPATGYNASYVYTYTVNGNSTNSVTYTLPTETTS